MLFQLSTGLSKLETIIADLDVFKDEFYSIAKLGSSLYFLMDSLSALRHEYLFSRHYFLQLFDEAICGQLPIYATASEVVSFVTPLFADLI